VQGHRPRDTLLLHVQLAAAAFKRLSPAYTVAFVIVRTLIGPPAVTWLARRLVLTDRLPLGLRCTCCNVKLPIVRTDLPTARLLDSGQLGSRQIPTQLMSP
jgi:hypothetical protein